MILVDRSAVAEPAGLKKYRDRGYEHARRYFENLEARRQERYFNPHWEEAYRVPIPALAKLFKGKCAFCESKVDLEARGILDHLRPKWATRGLHGEYAPKHYWWLAFTWSNLYLACPECNKHRGQRFPVKGKRVSGPDEDVRKERPVLVDPCVDRPDAHLRFDDKGRVEGLTECGLVTVDLLALNRSRLIESRQALARRILKVVVGVRGLHSLPRAAHMELASFIADDAEHAGFARQLLASKLSGGHQAQLWDKAHEKAASLLQTVRSWHQNFGPRFLDEVRIRNFRGISNLTLKVPSSDKTNLEWLMLIGENAAGKSSVLQALALNLMSKAVREGLKLTPTAFIRRGTRQAQVDVLFRGTPTWRRLRIAGGKFRCSEDEAGAPLMAYGATRLPPLENARQKAAPLKNMFNPFAPLVDAVEWLLSLSEVEFDYAARALKALLAIKQTVRFRRARGQVLVGVFGAEVPLSQLSDGYQSVIALAADMMKLIKRTFKGGFEVAEGIVLLDELGAHLHPRWKMRIAKALRDTFPRLQFIVTTHDPLCLRGLRNGEIAAVERTPRGRVFARTELPPIEGMRVDQILQSEYFGLRSAMDPDVEADFDRMYQLKAKPPSKLTSAQRATLAQLESRLAGVQVLGSTRSERLMLSEINRYLAKEETEPDQRRRAGAWKQAQSRIAARLEKDLGIAL